VVPSTTGNPPRRTLSAWGRGGVGEALLERVALKRQLTEDHAWHRTRKYTNIHIDEIEEYKWRRIKENIEGAHSHVVHWPMQLWRSGSA
jgi:hypothetical protein